MELTVLGSSGAWPSAAHPASGYLLQEAGFSICLDLGNGALTTLQQHVSIPELRGVVISHRHYDHFLDLYGVFNAHRLNPEPLPPIPLVGPPDFFEFFARLTDAESLDAAFEPRQVEPGGSFELGPFRFDTRPMQHWVTTLGVRVQAGGATLAYTGDTGPTGEVEAIGEDADLLIAEASWQDSPDERPPYHLTARQGAELATRAGARRLALTHFWPESDREVSRAQAAEAFDGELILAAEGLRIEVAP